VGRIFLTRVFEPSLSPLLIVLSLGLVQDYRLIFPEYFLSPNKDSSRPLFLIHEICYCTDHPVASKVPLCHCSREQENRVKGQWGYDYLPSTFPEKADKAPSFRAGGILSASLTGLLRGQGEPQNTGRFDLIPLFF
jgi:hypothetical protein